MDYNGFRYLLIHEIHVLIHEMHASGRRPLGGAPRARATRSDGADGRHALVLVRLSINSFFGDHLTSAIRKNEKRVSFWHHNVLKKRMWC